MILIDSTELKDVIRFTVKKAVSEQFHEEQNRKSPTVTIAETAKILCRAHLTVKKMVKSGIFNLTPDGKIRRSDVEKYLGIHQ